MAKINWTLGIQAVDGPKLVVTRGITLDAYERIDIDVPNGASKAVEVGAGTTADLVRFLLITATSYSPSLTYSTAAAGTQITLDEPQIWSGKGAMKLLTDKLGTLTFTNPDTKPQSVQIFVGREVS
jgi:hypothetical protein